MIKHLRRKITAGLITLTPIMGTLWILLFLFNFFDNLASPLIDTILPLDIPGVGIILTLIILYLLGIIVTNFLGKQLFTYGEKIINKIPLAKTIYGTAKQIVESVGTSSKKAFQKYQWPTIDVTRKSVEETAASIIKIHEIYSNKK